LGVVSGVGLVCPRVKFGRKGNPHGRGRRGTGIVAPFNRPGDADTGAARTGEQIDTGGVLAICLPLLGGPLAIVGTEATERTAIALRLARCADFLTVANQGDVKAEGHLSWNPPVQ